MTRDLTLDDAKRFKGRYGFFIRDDGLLDSAVARPGTPLMGARIGSHLVALHAG